MKNNIRIEWKPENDNELTIYFTKTYFPYYINIIIPAGHIQVSIDNAYLNQGQLALEASSLNGDYNLSEDNIAWYFDNEEEGYFTLYLKENDAVNIESAENIRVDWCLCFDFIGHIEH